MSTLNGNFVEHTIPNLNNATLDLLIADKPSTMNLVDFQTAMTPAPAYKVYTALLTQSGGDDTLSLNSGILTIGVTYEISYVGRENYDFTNVGAPNNDPGTRFIATGITPNSWGTGGSPDDLLSYNTGAPVVTVLENTIGNIWFSYNGDGNYSLNSDGLFLSNKTFCFSTNIAFNDLTVMFITQNSINYINISSTNSLFINVNDLLSNTPIEIRVYN